MKSNDGITRDMTGGKSASILRVVSRATFDLDILIKTARENTRRLLARNVCLLLAVFSLGMARAADTAGPPGPKVKWSGSISWLDGVPAGGMDEMGGIDGMEASLVEFAPEAQELFHKESGGRDLPDLKSCGSLFGELAVGKFVTSFKIPGKYAITFAGHQHISQARQRQAPPQIVRPVTQVGARPGCRTESARRRSTRPTAPSQAPLRVEVVARGYGKADFGGKTRAPAVLHCNV